MVTKVCMTTVPDSETNDSLKFLPVVPQHDTDFHDVEAYFLHMSLIQKRKAKQDTRVGTVQEGSAEQVSCM